MLYYVKFTHAIYSEFYSFRNDENLIGNVLIISIWHKTLIMGTRSNDYPKSMFWIRNKKFTPCSLNKRGE